VPVPSLGQRATFRSGPIFKAAYPLRGCATISAFGAGRGSKPVGRHHRRDLARANLPWRCWRWAMRRRNPKSPFTHISPEELKDFAGPRDDGSSVIDVRGTWADREKRRRARLIRRLSEGASLEHALAEQEARRSAEDEDRRKWLAETEWDSSGQAIEWAELENRRLAEIARKQLDAAARGGRPKQPLRDRQMAQEFLKRLPQSKMSKTALKVDIGRKHGLRRRAAIDAVDRGLKSVR
jgi:hypothetical protein